MTDMIEDGYKLSVLIWKDNLLFDGYIMELFPEIGEIDGLNEIVEGHMVYSGDLSEDELRQVFFDMGFVVETEN